MAQVAAFMVTGDKSIYSLPPLALQLLDMGRCQQWVHTLHNAAAKPIELLPSL
jgi:hypothetical protein